MVLRWYFFHSDGELIGAVRPFQDEKNQVLTINVWLDQVRLRRFILFQSPSKFWKIYARAAKNSLNESIILAKW